jgi:hypothetical protein
MQEYPFVDPTDGEEGESVIECRVCSPPAATRDQENESVCGLCMSD